jgi:hypothetical protein
MGEAYANLGETKRINLCLYTSPCWGRENAEFVPLSAEFVPLQEQFLPNLSP